MKTRESHINACSYAYMEKKLKFQKACAHIMNPGECSSARDLGEKEFILILAIRDKIEVHKETSVVPRLESSRKQWLT
jgi:hypothetical protein